MQEIRRALRALSRSPGSTAIAVLTLALGIGGATAIFSVVYGVLLRALPYPEPDRIVQLFQIFESGGKGQFSNPNFEDIRDRSRSFRAVAQFSSWVVSVSGGREPVRARVATVSREFFDVLGTDPLRGRLFVDEELREGGEPAVVVSYGFFQRLFGDSADLSGSSLAFLQRSHAVVGVMPPELQFPPETEIWVPRELDPPRPSRTAHNWQALARLADGVTVEQARSDVSSIARELKQTYGEDTWMVDATVVPLREELVGSARPALVVLLAAVGVLLLVACANVVNLLLARAASRQRELAVQKALGASSFRLVRPFLAESLLLSLAGGGLGVAAAFWGVPILLAFEPGKLPRVAEIGVSIPVLLFALGVSFAVSLALGLTSAMRSEGGLTESLKERSRAGGSRRLRNALVVSQVALTLVLLVGAGLLGRSLLRLLQRDSGFRSEGVLVIDLSHPGPRDDSEKRRLGALQSELLSRMSAIAGVASVGATDRLPLSTGTRNGMFLVVSSQDEVQSFEDFGRLMQDPERAGMAEYRAGTDDYFRTMGIPLLTGRAFEPGDAIDAPHVCLVSASLARERWPDGEAIGKLIEFGNMDGDLRLMRVVGIVGDVRHGGLDSEARPTIYVNARQRPPSNFTLVLGVRSNPADVAAQARAVVQDLAPDIPPRMQTIDEIVGDSVADRRFNAILVGAFGLTALALAVMGIYGVVSYGVSERTREIGLRMALGARPTDVVSLVVGQGSRLIVVGVAVGLVLALGLTRLMSNLLYEVSATDPVTYVGLALPLALVALAACYLPARQASRVDPMVSLRYE